MMTVILRSQRWHQRSQEAFPPFLSEEGGEEEGVFLCKRVHQLGKLWTLPCFGTRILCCCCCCSVVECRGNKKRRCWGKKILVQCQCSLHLHEPMRPFLWPFHVALSLLWLLIPLFVCVTERRCLWEIEPSKRKEARQGILFSEEGR